VIPVRRLLAQQVLDDEPDIARFGVALAPDSAVWNFLWGNLGYQVESGIPIRRPAEQFLDLSQPHPDLNPFEVRVADPRRRQPEQQIATQEQQAEKAGEQGQSLLHVFHPTNRGPKTRTSFRRFDQPTNFIFGKRS